MDSLLALRLQIEWGADEALDDAPVDRMGREAPSPASRHAPQAVPPQAAPSRGGVVARAQLAADSAHTLEALYRTLAGFSECALAATATNLAVADGQPGAGLVLIGEAAGDEDDRTGRPLAGAVGAFLDRMLASIGLTRAALLVTNLIPWRPPGGRAPTDSEVAICAPFLWRHLTLLRPHTIVTLGALPARVLTGRAEPLRRFRGRSYNVTVPGLPAPIYTLPIMHPATLLRMPAAKKDAWTDLVALRRHLDAN